MKDKISLPFLIYVLSLFACIWAYTPGLSGPFFFDDYWNIVDNYWLHLHELSLDGLWDAAVSGQSGPLKRPVSMLSFAINHLITGLDPYWMKLTNLIIHIVNSIILLLVLLEIFRSLSDRYGEKYLVNTAYVIAAIWTIHPINVTAVSYIVQRMTLLSSLFMLGAILVYLRLRKKDLATLKGYGLTLLIVVFWLLGLLSKEIAILLGLYILLIEWRLYMFRADSKVELHHLCLTIGSLVLPVVLGVIYVFINSRIYFVEAYQIRDFNLYERMLTEGRIVVEYIRLIVIPDVTNMSIFSDDINISSSLIEPFTTLLSYLLILALLYLAYLYRIRFPLFFLGAGWFFIGHSLESTALPLELSFLHRNYLPSVGILLIAAEVILSIYHVHRRFALSLVFIFFVVFTGCTRLLSWQWSDNVNYLLSNAVQHPDSIRANRWAGNLLMLQAMKLKSTDDQQIFIQEAEKHHKKIKEMKPTDISVELNSLRAYLQFNRNPPQGLLDNITSRMVNADVLASDVSTIVVISHCIFESHCMLKSEIYEDIIIAMIGSKTISPGLKSNVLAMYASYMDKIKGDLHNAIELQKQAISTEPAILNNYRSLIKFYAKANNYDSLDQALKEFKKRDRFNVYKNFTSTYETLLLNLHEDPSIQEG